MLGSHDKMANYSIDKSLNNISSNNDDGKIKNFFMTPGINNDSRKMNNDDIFTANINNK